MTAETLKLLGVTLFTFGIIAGMFLWAIKASEKWEKEQGYPEEDGDKWEWKDNKRPTGTEQLNNGDRK